MADYVEEIKAKLGIYEVVSQYVQLKQAGRNYKGLCPFHGESTPSFVVSPEKQICHCFGCNRGGDIFTFVQDLEGVSFPEALEILADRAGVKIDRNEVKKTGPSKSIKDGYFKAQDLACEFFEKQLHTTNDGKKVLEYLEKRGLTDETIKKFRLGFAPDSYDSLYPYLLKKGVHRDILLDSGLATSKSLADEKIYDKYRGRLIFPIWDYLGRISGFGGRALKADQMPKYLNSPENPIYNKSNILFGLSHAKQAIKESDEVVLVEGYFDVILPHQAGVENVVATSGTALTPDHVRLVKRLTHRVVTSFDTDSAGFEATKRAYFLLIEQKMSVKTVVGLSGKDPADFVRAGESFEKIVNEAVNFVSFFIDRLLEQYDKDDLDGRKKIIAELLPCYKQMSPTTRDFFVRELSSKLAVSERYIYDEIEYYKLPNQHPARAQAQNTVNVSKLSPENRLLGIFLEFPALFRPGLNLFSESDLLAAIYNGLTAQYNSSRENSKTWNFKESILADTKAKIDVMRLSVEEEYSGFTQKALQVEVEKLVDSMEKGREIGRRGRMLAQIAEAEKAGDTVRSLELLKELQNMRSN